MKIWGVCACVVYRRKQICTRGPRSLGQRVVGSFRIRTTNKIRALFWRRNNQRISERFKALSFCYVLFTFFWVLSIKYLLLCHHNQVNEKLTRELEMIKQKLNTSDSQLQEITAERITNSRQVTALEAECSQLIREKEELLSKMNEGRHEELTEIKEKYCQLRWDGEH